LAYSACGNLAGSEDLAQETFIAAWQKLGELREPARLRGWLCGIVRNLAANAIRREQRRGGKAQSLDSVMLALGGAGLGFVRARDYRYYQYAIIARIFIVVALQRHEEGQHHRLGDLFLHSVDVTTAYPRGWPTFRRRLRTSRPAGPRREVGQ